MLSREPGKLYCPLTILYSFGRSPDRLFHFKVPVATLDAYIRAGFRESVGFRFQKKEKIPNLSGPGSIGIGKFVRKSVAVVREDLNLYVVRA